VFVKRVTNPPDLSVIKLACPATGAFLLLVLVTGCYPSDYGPVLDIPISPATGHIRSPPFAIDPDDIYDIGIGINGMPVDQDACLATVSDFLRKTSPPCHAITPAIGAFTWRVIHAGTVVAQGSKSGLPSLAIPDGRSPPPRTTITPEAIIWDFFAHFRAQAGRDYVIELDMRPQSVSLEQFHPRLAIVKNCFKCAVSN
jgi:hypothetical protein